MPPHPVLVRSARRSSGAFALLFALFALLAGCGDSGTGPDGTAGAPADLELLGGDDQDGAAGANLPEQLRFAVTDADGDRTIGHVQFGVIEGGGMATPQSILTLADGLAITTWRLGESTGEQRMRARLLNREGVVVDSVEVTATAVAAAPALVEIAGGQGQAGPPQATLGDSLVIVVMDQYGNRVPNAAVTWTIAQGTGAALSATSTTTSAQGRTGVRLTLGNEGEHRVRATINGIITEFRAFATLATHPAGTIVGTMPFAGAFGVAVSDAGRVAVAALGGSVLVSDTLGGSRDTVALDGLPVHVAFEPGSSFAWVSRRNANAATRVDAVAGTVGTSVAAPASPFAIAVSPDGSRLFVAGDDSLRAYLLPGGARAGAVALGQNSEGIAFNADGSRLYVGAHAANGGSVLEVNPQTMAVTRSFTGIGGKVQGLTFWGDYVYGVLEEGALFRIEVASGLVTGVTLPGGAYDVEVTPDGARLWVSIMSTGEVWIYDRETGGYLGKVTVGGTPRVIAFNRKGGRAFVANEGGYVTIVD